MPYIECRDLYKNYPGQKALDGASMTLEKGEFVALQGISGSGKSTLLALIGLLDLPSSGDIFIDGQPTAGAGFTARCHLRNQHFGFVFQQFHLIGDFTVLENVQLPLRYSGLSRRHWRARAIEILDKVGLANRHHNLPGELSGGEQQRVAIARALVSRPGLLLADEPTGNLDSKTGEHIMALFQTLHQEGMGLLMATHNPAYAGRAQRCLHLQDGRFSDTPA